jgi:crotonobetainyl-CoA:carnitine CoA-transferase CaiB-like acyl-CoA transferase
VHPLLQGVSVSAASFIVAPPTAEFSCAPFGAEVIRVDQIGGVPDFRRWPATEVPGTRLNLSSGEIARLIDADSVGSAKEQDR